MSKHITPKDAARQYAQTGVYLEWWLDMPTDWSEAFWAWEKYFSNVIVAR